MENYIRWSEAFRTWIEGLSEVSNQGVDFFGSPIATRLTEDWNYSWHYIQEAETNFLPEDYTYSIYAKAEERSLLKLVSSNSNTFDGMAIFDLENGQILEGDGLMADEGDGWYRCGVSSAVVNSFVFNIRVMMCSLNEEGDITDDYKGDGKSGLNIYGAQINLGLDMENYVLTEGWPR